MKSYDHGPKCSFVVVGVGGVEFEEGRHAEEGLTDTRVSEVLEQLLVDAQDLTDVTEDSHDNVIWYKI